VGREEKKLRTHIVLIALCAMAPASGLVAQPAGPPAFTSEEREVIRRHVLQERRPSITTPADLVPTVGASMPAGIELFWMPPGAGLNRYRYAVVNQRALVLDYQDRRVIEILEPPPQRQ
jgi:Protein of unknown function (DUF1236)